MFPGAPLEVIDILKKLLKFNPNQRITLDECLNHPFITAYSKREQTIGVASGPAMDQSML